MEMQWIPCLKGQLLSQSAKSGHDHLAERHLMFMSIVRSRRLLGTGVFADERVFSGSDQAANSVFTDEKLTRPCHGGSQHVRSAATICLVCLGLEHCAPC